MTILYDFFKFDTSVSKLKFWKPDVNIFLLYDASTF
jgi:hypothetical protein